MPSNLGHTASWHQLESQLPVKAFASGHASRQKFGWRKKIFLKVLLAFEFHRVGFLAHISRGQGSWGPFHMVVVVVVVVVISCMLNNVLQVSSELPVVVYCC